MDIATALRTVSKALAGAIVGAIAYFLAKYNIVLDSSLNDALQVIIMALIGFAAVFISPKNAGPSK